MKEKFYAILNTISVVAVLGVNYYSVAYQINGNNVGQLSAEYENLFTPAGYAFSIWSVIFLSLIAYVVYQLINAFGNKHKKEYQQTGIWFAIVNFCNATWVFVWLYEYTGLSVIVMAVMLIGLITIVIKTNMERWDADLKTIAFIWWPICLYAGWISVAMIANISAYLSKLEWEGGPLSEISWTIIMMVIAAAVNIFMIWNRNMREFALVGIWALVAIFVRHQGSMTTIAWTAVILAGVIFINVAIHGYQNRKTSPVSKLMN
ncbi:MAG: hypothetical protein WBA74_19315 [Cyclobacteriaceae bacterium]